MGQAKGKWIRLECDNCENYHFSRTQDYSGKTYQKIYKQIKIDGWRKHKGKWYCPACNLKKTK